MKILFKTLFLLVITLIFTTQNLIAYPSQSLPMNENNMTQIGTGTLHTIGGSGSFYNYNVTDTNLSVLMLKMTVVTGSDGGLGAIQVFDDLTQILIPYGASDHIDWSSQQSPDTWYSTGIIETLDSMNVYAIHRAAYNGNQNYAGGTNNNFTYYRSTATMYYYIGFASPVHITDVKLGNGTNRDIDYNVEFFSDNINLVPEPASMVLLGLGVVGVIIRKIKK